MDNSVGSRGDVGREGWGGAFRRCKVLLLKERGPMKKIKEGRNVIGGWMDDDVSAVTWFLRRRIKCCDEDLKFGTIAFVLV